MIKKYKEKIRKHFREVIKIKKSPFSIALGFALGTFLAILPTFGFGILIGLLIILIFKNISKVAMLAAFAIWNPLVLVPLAAASYKLGDIILADIPVRTLRFEILNRAYIYSRRYLVGNFIISLVSSILSYVIAYFATKKYQNRIKP